MSGDISNKKSSPDGNIIAGNAPQFVQILLMGDGDHFPFPVSIRNGSAEDRLDKANGFASYQRGAELPD
jgi:hypothetical protein